MRAYCLSENEIEAVLRHIESETEPSDTTLAEVLEEAKSWEAKLIVVALFIARVLERYRGQSARQALVIQSLHDAEQDLWLEIQEMDHDYIRQLFHQDPGPDRTLDEILTEVAARIAVHDYAKTLCA